jgi:hypothetical protein
LAGGWDKRGSLLSPPRALKNFRCVSLAAKHEGLLLSTVTAVAVSSSSSSPSSSSSLARSLVRSFVRSCPPPPGCSSSGQANTCAALHGLHLLTLRSRAHQALCFWLCASFSLFVCFLSVFFVCQFYYYFACFVSSFCVAPLCLSFFFCRLFVSVRVLSLSSSPRFSAFLLWFCDFMRFFCFCFFLVLFLRSSLMKLLLLWMMFLFPSRCLVSSSAAVRVLSAAPGMVR